MYPTGPLSAFKNDGDYWPSRGDGETLSTLGAPRVPCTPCVPVSFPDTRSCDGALHFLAPLEWRSDAIHREWPFDP